MHDRGQQPFSDQELERVLRDMPDDAIYPPTPDLASTVADELAAQAKPRRLFTINRMSAVAAVLLLALAAVIMFDASARETVAGWLGLRGVEVHQVDATPTAIDRQPELSDIGQQVTLSEAQARADFPIQIPTSLDRPPDAVYIDSWPPGGKVSLVYEPTAQLPETAFPGVGLLLTEFQGSRTPNASGKGIPPDATLEQVEVNGQPGVWISGSPHIAYTYHTREGETTFVDARLAGNVLLWERDGITYRLEAQILLPQAVKLAESLRPAQP